MIFADKMIALRKKMGWSQEELAERLNVSRQSVSKWEGAQSLPDTDRILQIADLFGVTTDYLLKDDIEQEMYADEVTVTVKRLSLSEAAEFLEIRRTTARRIALGVMLCILSPICLIFLGAATDFPFLGISEPVASAVGLGVLLLMVAVAVALFIHSGLKMAPYEYLSKEVFRTENGVEELAREERNAFGPRFTRSIIVGVALCIASSVPVIAGGIVGHDLLMAAMLCLTLVMIAVGVYLLLRAGTRRQSVQILLQEDEYSPENKQLEKKREVFDSVYWILMTAIYLTWSFVGDAWERSWILWPIAGVVFAAIVQILNAKNKR